MKKILLGMSAILLLSGCANTITKEEAYPDMYREKPVSIMVVPAINKSTAADAPDLYSSTINEPLSNAGFYVLPTEVTDRILRSEGLTYGDQIKDIPPQKFHELFGADAVFYATINKWDTSYYVIGGHVAVEIEFEMKSSRTGESLWAIKRQMTVDTSEGGSGHIIADLLITAIKTAVQDYVPVARQVNLIALHNIPYGKYHNQHGQDQQMKVIWPETTKSSDS